MKEQCQLVTDTTAKRHKTGPRCTFFFEVRHPHCVSNKSNYKVCAYIVKHNYVLGGILFTIRKARLHVLATVTSY
jgi:hypothetical protein